MLSKSKKILRLASYIFALLLCNSAFSKENIILIDEINPTLKNNLLLSFKIIKDQREDYYSLLDSQFSAIINNPKSFCIKQKDQMSCNLKQEEVFDYITGPFSLFSLGKLKDNQEKTELYLDIEGEKVRLDKNKPFLLIKNKKISSKKLKKSTRWIMAADIVNYLSLANKFVRHGYQYKYCKTTLWDYLCEKKEDSLFYAGTFLYEHANNCKKCSLEEKVIVLFYAAAYLARVDSNSQSKMLAYNIVVKNENLFNKHGFDIRLIKTIYLESI